MPTGAEYRAMAAELVDRADTLRALTGPLVEAWGEGVVSTATRVGLVIARAVEAADVNSGSARATMHAMAGECRARAAVCDQYTAAMQRYRADLGRYERDVRAAAADPAGPASLPTPPTRPVAPSWAEEGSSPAGPR